jgi:hypothetical protein
MAKENDIPLKNALLYPFSSNGYSRGVCLALIPAVISCVITRAPQYSLQAPEAGGWNLPFPLDAITLILISPFYFLVVSWLLKRTAERAGSPSEKWELSDVRIMTGLTALLGTSAAFLLLQFFLVFAPAGKCDLKLGPNILWNDIPGSLQIQHCMSTAATINAKSWHYIAPLWLHAWLNVILVAISLWLLWSAWRAWKNTLPRLARTPKTTT